MGVGIAIAIAVILFIVGIAGGYFIGTSTTKTSTTTINLTETGSSLLYPLFNDYWFPNYTASNVVLSAASTGSGTGQSDSELGLVNIGASDAYLLNASATNLINVPVAISGQLVYYNLPAPLNGIHLNFNGTVLAMIYGGVITTWDNPLILAAQPPAVQSDLKALSSQTIYLAKRADSSGDTFLWTSLCYLSWKGFPYPVSTSGLSGLTGSNVIEGTGNSGIISAIAGQTNSIGYVGISYEASAASKGLEYGALGDNLTLTNGSYSNPIAAANYVLPSPTNISSDANLALQRLNFASYGLALSMILGGVPGTVITSANLGTGGTNPAPGTTPYPDANLEYTLIKKAPVGSVVTSAALAATVAFEKWAISSGNFNPSNPSTPSAWIQGVNFVPLTQEVIGYDMQELATVTT